MTVLRYRKKPQPPREDEGLTAAKYDPPVTPEMSADLLEVARLNDDLAEVREVAFPSGKRVLLVRYFARGEGGSGEWEYVTVEPGDYLMCSGDWDNLDTRTEAGLARWYEPAAVIDAPGE